MMNRQEHRTVGPGHERALGKVVIAIAVAAFAWLSACPEESQAERGVATRIYRGQVAEKPLPPPRVNAPMIVGVSETEEGYVDIRYQNFAAHVSRIVLERQLVTQKGDGKWFVMHGMNIHDHRDEFDLSVRDNQRRPGAVYVYQESTGLTPGDQYRYRVRATQPYKPRPVELLSAVKTITVKPPEIPTPPTPKPHTSKPHTSDPNYNRVHEMSAEAMSMARQMHLLSTRIPPTYGSLRTSIISWSDRTHTAALSARRDSESVVVNGTSPTPDLHQRILEASTQGERYAEQAEDDAGDLKRQADKRNDDRTEDLARALRELADDAGDKLRDCKKLFD